MSTEGKENGYIRVLGAQQNNLKNIDVEIPLNSLTVLTGVSGSGKSSLAFDTLYAEGQRRYVESLSAYARQFLERIEKPRVREIEGISPAISIRQKNTSRNPRSTVGTVTEIYDYLRLLYARLGEIRCRKCGRPVGRDTIDDIVQRLLQLPEGTRLYVAFPFRQSLFDFGSGEERTSLRANLDSLLKAGFRRLLLEGKLEELPHYQPSSLRELQGCQVLVDRLVVRSDLRDRLVDSLEICYAEGNGVALVIPVDRQGGLGEPMRFTERFECQYCQIPYRAPEPRLFSFNNPYGACPTCQGFGNTMGLDENRIIPDPERSLAEGAVEPFTKPRYRRFQRRLEEFARRSRSLPLEVPYRELTPEQRRILWEGEGGFPGIRGFFRYLERKKYKMHIRVFMSRYRGYARCPDCQGERLCQEARDVYVGDKRISELTRLPISELRDFFSRLEWRPSQQEVAGRVRWEIEQRLDFLIQVGLEYLTLDRITSTLSGGEMQRIQLAAALGSSLVGTLYVLDEPSIGLHPRDERRLIQILKHLRDQGNTIVVVEHEEEMIRAADHIIDLGPGAGERGGEVLHSGDLASLLENRESVTGAYLSGRARLATPVFRRTPNEHFLVIRGARQHNLKNLTVRIPLGVLVCVTGVSGSGKSTLVQDVLYAGLRRLQGGGGGEGGACDEIQGWENLSEVLLIDQTPIGKTPRSNPVTYIKAFDEIRQLFAQVREARALNLTPGHFSFNIPGGRCETCQGAGTMTVEMQFLADVEVPCEDCRGRRFQNRILEVRWKGKNIAEVLELTVNQALEFFSGPASLRRKLKVLQEVGLGYLRLGQPATTLSGGEAQRIKLASYLGRKTSSHPLFIFDEPTTGLHFDDIQKLLKAFDRLLARGATVLVIEHNLNVIKSADWVIDLGPEGGEKGGFIVAEGPPEKVAQEPRSYTGQFLRSVLEIPAL